MARKIGPVERGRLEWVNSFESSRRWFEALKTERTGSIHTQLAFSKGLKFFCDFVGKNPDKLIEERKSDLKSDDQQVRRRSEDMLRKFFIHLCDKGMSRATARIHHSAVKSFYKHNYYPLIEAKTPPVLYEERPPVTIEELRKIDDITDVREKAIIRFLKDSGMSRGDVSELRYKVIQKEFEEGKDFIHLRVVRQKALVRYETFIGPNAVQALRNYFEVRTLSGEVITPETPLFASISRKRWPLRPETITVLLMRLGSKIGIKLSPHRIRKFFETRMAIGKVHPIISKYWMGHKVKGGADVEARYIIPTTEEQRSIYMEAYSNIDLTPAKPAVDELQIQFVMLKERARRMGLDPIQIFRMKRVERAPLAERYRILEELTLRRPYVGKKTRKVISEEQLENELNHGWSFVSVLPSGKILIEKEE